MGHVKRREPIRWHRFAAEICDSTILRHFHELYAEYRGMIQAKQRMNPFTEYKPMNLTVFTMHILEVGIETVAKELLKREANKQ